MVNPIAEKLVDLGAIEFGTFRLASGATSSYYINIKSAVTNPDLLFMIAAEIAKRFPFDVVAGVEVGAVPLAVAVSIASKKPYAIIRKEEKSHGIREVIIGSVTNKRVLLVEDVTTSGKSALYGITVLRASGAIIDQVVTVVDREAGAVALLSQHDITFTALVSVSEILNSK